MFTMEWGVSKSVCKEADLGLVGYYQQQVTKDSGTGAATAMAHVVGVGPEVRAFCPQLV